MDAAAWRSTLSKCLLLLFSVFGCSIAWGDDWILLSSHDDTSNYTLKVTIDNHNLSYALPKTTPNRDPNYVPVSLTRLGLPDGEHSIIVASNASVGTCVMDFTVGMLKSVIFEQPNSQVAFENLQLTGVPTKRKFVLNSTPFMQWGVLTLTTFKTSTARVPILDFLIAKWSNGLAYRSGVTFQGSDENGVPTLTSLPGATLSDIDSLRTFETYDNFNWFVTRGQFVTYAFGEPVQGHLATVTKIYDDNDKLFHECLRLNPSSSNSNAKLGAANSKTFNEFYAIYGGPEESPESISLYKQWANTFADSQNIPRDIFCAMIKWESKHLFRQFANTTLSNGIDVVDTLVSGDGGVGLGQITGANLIAGTAAGSAAVNMIYQQSRSPFANLQNAAKLLNSAYRGLSSYVDFRTGGASNINNRNCLEAWYYALWYYNAGKSNSQNPVNNSVVYMDNVYKELNSNTGYILDNSTSPSSYVKILDPKQLSKPVASDVGSTFPPKNIAYMPLPFHTVGNDRQTILVQDHPVDVSLTLTPGSAPDKKIVKVSLTNVTEHELGGVQLSWLKFFGGTYAQSVFPVSDLMPNQSTAVTIPLTSSGSPSQWAAKIVLKNGSFVVSGQLATLPLVGTYNGYVYPTNPTDAYNFTAGTQVIIQSISNGSVTGTMQILSNRPRSFTGTLTGTVFHAVDEDGFALDGKLQNGVLHGTYDAVDLDLLLEGAMPPSPGVCCSMGGQISSSDPGLNSLALNFIITSEGKVICSSILGQGTGGGLSATIALKSYYEVGTFSGNISLLSVEPTGYHLTGTGTIVLSDVQFTNTPHFGTWVRVSGGTY